MAKDPAFLFYYKDWLATTRFMKPDDKGYFMDLLCYQAEYWTIPESVIEAAIPQTNWRSIAHLFQHNKAGYYNSMQRLHLEKRRKFSESRRLNRLGKKKQVNNTSKTIEQLPVNATVNENEGVTALEIQRKKNDAEERRVQQNLKEMGLDT